MKERPSEIYYRRIGNKESLEVIGIGDVSYKVDEFAVGGNLIFLKISQNIGRLSRFKKFLIHPSTWRH